RRHGRRPRVSRRIAQPSRDPPGWPAGGDAGGHACVSSARACEILDRMTTMTDLMRDVADRCSAYMTGAAARRVAPGESAIPTLVELNLPFPENGMPLHDVVERLDRIGSPATVMTTGGRYYGFVNGGALPATTAASWFVSAWNQNVALRVMSPAGAAF